MTFLRHILQILLITTFSIFATVSAGASTAIYGGSFEDAFKESLKSAALSELTDAGFHVAGDAKLGLNLDDGTLGAALVHGVIGCAAYKAGGQSCGQGFAQASLTELYSGTIDDPESMSPEEADARRARIVETAAIIIGGLVSGGDVSNVGRGRALGVSAFNHNYLKHAEAVKLEQCIADGDNACVARLNALHSERNRQLRACEGDVSATCDQVRDELRYAVANYLEEESTNGFEIFSSAGYFAHDAMLSYGYWGHGNENQLYGNGFTDPRAVAILTNTREENERLVRANAGSAGTSLAASEGLGMEAFIANRGLRYLLAGKGQFDSVEDILGDPRIKGKPATESSNDVKDLFRGDGRSHEQVFDEGLVPWDPDGTLDLEIHVNSNPSPTSGNQWTSTSTDPKIAASSDFSGPGGNVYHIDGNVPGQVNVNQTLGIDNVDFSYESEIAISGGIDTCFIRGCSIVQPDGSLDHFIPNPNYTGGR